MEVEEQLFLNARRLTLYISVEHDHRFVSHIRLAFFSLNLLAFTLPSRASIPDKTSATLAKFLNKTQVSKHPPPMPLKQRLTNPPKINIDLEGARGDFCRFMTYF